MPSPLENTRVGDMFDSLCSLPAPETPSEISDRMEQAQRMVFAAMGAEYLALQVKTNSRSVPEAVKHWLNFCSLANPALFGTPEKLAKLKPVLTAVLRDMQDIVSRKI